MARKKLVSEPSTYSDLIIFGINSQIKDYRMAFLLNQEAGLSLKKLDDLPVFFEKENQLPEYPLYYHYESNSRIQYYLLGNNHPVTKLFPSYKQADFLLLIKGLPDPTFITDVSLNIRNIKGVLLVFKIDLPKVKNLEGFMSDLELHMVGK